MKYYLAGPQYAFIDPRPISERIFENEQSALDAAFTQFYTKRPQQIDVMRVLDEQTLGSKRVISLHLRKGKGDPAVWMGDGVTEPIR